MASVRPMASSDTIPVSLLRTSERKRSGTVVSARVPWMDRSSDTRAFYGVDGEVRMSNVEFRMSNFEFRMSNDEFRMTNLECFFILHSTFEIRHSKFLVSRTITLNAPSSPPCPRAPPRRLRHHPRPSHPAERPRVEPPRRRLHVDREPAQGADPAAAERVAQADDRGHPGQPAEDPGTARHLHGQGDRVLR